MLEGQHARGITVGLLPAHVQTWCLESQAGTPVFELIMAAIAKRLWHPSVRPLHPTQTAAACQPSSRAGSRAC